jgi:hypothetical protein
MKLESIVADIKATGLHPIPVECRENKDSYEFAGTFEEFAETAKVLGAKAILVSVETLPEEAFFCENDKNDDDQSDEDDDLSESDDESAEDKIDLCAIHPNLSAYKKYIGEGHTATLTIEAPDLSLEYAFQEDWVRPFSDEREKAKAIVAEDVEKAQEKIEAKNQARQTELLKMLKELSRDTAMSQITTQRAMRLYALDKNPELAELDEQVFAEEIRRISDRNQIRKNR